VSVLVKFGSAKIRVLVQFGFRLIPISITTLSY